MAPIVFTCYTGSLR